MPNRFRRAYVYKLQRLVTRQTELFPHAFSDAITSILNPHRTIAKHGRVWRVSLPRTSDGFVHGRLGFSRSAEAMTALYDEHSLDFIREPVSTARGEFANFTISLRSQILAFETVPGQIARSSFVGRFSDFITLAGEPFSLQAITPERRFEQWRRTVDRVVRLDISISRPNPDVTKATERTLKRLTTLSADLLRTTAESAQPEGLNTDAPELGDAIKHASSGYGRYRAVGERGDRQVELDSQAQARSQLIPRDSEQVPEAVQSELARLVRDAEADERLTS